MENSLEIHHEKWFWKLMKMRIRLFLEGVFICLCVPHVFLTILRSKVLVGKKKQLRFFRQGSRTPNQMDFKGKTLPIITWKGLKSSHVFGEKKGEIWWRLYPCLPRNPFTLKNSETDFNHPLGNATEVFSIFWHHLHWKCLFAIDIQWWFW